MNFERRMKRHIDMVLDSLVPNPYARKPSFPSWAKFAIPALAAATIAAIVLPITFINLNRGSVGNDPYPLSSSSSDTTNIPSSFLYLAVQERLTISDVTYQAVFSSDLGRIEPEKKGEVAIWGNPYAGIVKEGYEAEFEAENPGMPYLVNPRNRFADYLNFVYIYEAEGYDPRKVILIEGDLYVAFFVELPERFELEGREYRSTSSSDLSVLDGNKFGEKAFPSGSYAAMVKESYSASFIENYPRTPYFTASADKFNDVTNYAFLNSIRGIDPSIGLLFEGIIYKA